MFDKTVNFILDKKQINDYHLFMDGKISLSKRYCLQRIFMYKNILYLFKYYQNEIIIKEIDIFKKILLFLLDDYTVVEYNFSENIAKTKSKFFYNNDGFGYYYVDDNTIYSLDEKSEINLKTFVFYVFNISLNNYKNNKVENYISDFPD